MKPTANSSLADWLRWQEQLHPKSIELGLDRVRAVAQKLGLPASGMRTITVAGTNGKGSSTALLSEILLAAGYRVGTYTSPHLRRYNERVAIGGRPVEDTELCEAFCAVEEVRGATPLTYFEFGTLAALWLFRRARVQVQVLEVGLGGRLDAVNLVDADCALITNIGLDHCEYLGHDRESIGREKAGVLRAGQPAVCVDPRPPASLAQEAERRGASLWQLGRDYSWQPAGDAWSWHGAGVTLKKLPPPGLRGAIQFRNAAGVLAVLRHIHGILPVSEAAIRAALPRLQLPGRFQRRGRYVLDVAHNAEAAAVLAENLHDASLAPAVLVLGMLNDKPVEAFCSALAAQVRCAVLAGLPGPRGFSAAELAGRAAGSGIPLRVCADIPAALECARERAGEDGTILVCGSFLTVAAAMDVLDEWG